MSNELPEPWGPALSQRGVHSYRDLASRLDISVGTAHRLVTGKTSNATIQLAADEFFGGDGDAVRTLRGESARGFGPWDPPDSAHLLNPDQRAALEQLIKTIVQGGAEDDSPAANKEPATGPAKQPVLREVHDHQVDLAARADPKQRRTRGRSTD